MPTVQVVLVDDAPFIYEALQMFFSKDDGIQMIAYAPTGELGVQLLENVRCDVAVLDVLMPGINGFQ
jgi:DNA-binding NarL/FixJ family response regulator